MAELALVEGKRGSVSTEINQCSVVLGAKRLPFPLATRDSLPQSPELSPFLPNLSVSSILLSIVSEVKGGDTVSARRTSNFFTRDTIGEHRSVVRDKLKVWFRTEILETTIKISVS